MSYEPKFHWIKFKEDEDEEEVLTVGEYNPKNPGSGAYMRVIGLDEMIPLPDKRIRMMDEVTRGFKEIRPELPNIKELAKILDDIPVEAPNCGRSNFDMARAIAERIGTAPKRIEDKEYILYFPKEDKYLGLGSITGGMIGYRHTEVRKEAIRYPRMDSIKLLQFSMGGIIQEVPPEK